MNAVNEHVAVAQVQLRAHQAVEATRVSVHQEATTYVDASVRRVRQEAFDYARSRVDEADQRVARAEVAAQAADAEAAAHIQALTATLEEREIEYRDSIERYEASDAQWSDRYAALVERFQDMEAGLRGALSDAEVLRRNEVARITSELHARAAAARSAHAESQTTAAGVGEVSGHESERSGYFTPPRGGVPDDVCFPRCLP